MYPINVSFKDILRIGTADSSFSLIWTGLVHDYVHVFLQVFVHSFLSFTTPQFLSNTGLRTCLVHQSAVPFEHGSMDLPRSPVRSSFRTRVHGPASVTSPQFLSNTGPCTCLGHQAAVSFEHGSTHLCRSPLRLSFIGSPVLISFLSRVHGPVLFTVSHFLRPSSVPTSPVVHQFPVGARCVYGGAVCNDLVNQL
jgi:hypothetical protein